MISGKEKEKQIMDKSKNISRIPSEMKSFKKRQEIVFVQCQRYLVHM